MSDVSPFVLLPVCIGAFWLVHVILHSLGRKGARSTGIMIFAGIPTLAIVFFVSSIYMEDPYSSQFSTHRGGNSGLVNMFLAFECIGIWIIAISLEILVRCLPSKGPRTRRQEVGNT